MMSGYNPDLEGAGSFLSGLFTDASAPYNAAQGPYNQYMGMASGAQNPFYQAGTGAIGNYQHWLQGMSNPSQFINGLMNQYQQSPWAQYQQLQATRAAQNLGSATGLTGSTPLMQQAQQNSANISSQDMQNWLQNVLGINTQYGAGQQNLIGAGQNSANALSSIYGNQAQGLGQLAYGERMGENQNRGNLIGGGLELLGSAASSFV